MRPRNLWISILALAAACGDPGEIHRYRAPKDARRTVVPTPPPHPTTEAAGRMLGAILPHADGMWFFKLKGSPEQLEPHVEAFARLVGSVHFTPDIAWTLPEGWKQVGGSGFRVATILVSPPEPPLEISVTQAGGGVLANVNRWRGQLGLPEIEESQLDANVKRVKVGEAEAILVDFRSEEAPAPPASPITFDVPAGWTQNPAPSQDWLFEFQAGPEVNVTIATGGGGVRADVDRWRKQVGLPPVESPEVKEVATKDATLQWVELFGAEQGLLIAFRLSGASPIFIKMTGPVEKVREQKAAFDGFLASVRLGG